MNSPSSTGMQENQWLPDRSTPGAGVWWQPWMPILRSTLVSKNFPQLLLAAGMTNLFIFAIPLFSMAVFDKAIPHGAFETLWALAMGTSIVIATELASRLIRGRIEREISARASYEMQQRMLTACLDCEISSAPRTGSGLISALQAVDAATSLMPPLVVAIIIDLPFVMLLLLYIGATTGWVVVAPIICGILVMVVTLVALSVAERHSRTATHFANQRSAAVEESVSKLALLKSICGNTVMRHHFAELSAKSLRSAMATKEASSASTHLAIILLQFNVVGALFLGTYAVSNAEMTVGTLAATIMLLGRGMSPLVSLATLLQRGGEITAGLTIANRYAALEPETAGDSQSKLPVWTELRLHSASLSYKNSKTVSLKNVSLIIRRNERIAIIGGMGSGKSSLLEVIARTHLPTEGEFLLDGREIRQFDPTEYRREVRYMHQDSELFEGTIRGNVTLGLEDCQDDTFAQAITVSSVAKITARNPAGLEMQVGRDGRNLSGGERQAVCLARTLVRPGSITILDEPTSAMDNQMEREVVTALENCLQNQTVIIATHRLPLLALTDRIIWLENGSIVADGPKAEVLAKIRNGM